MEARILYSESEKLALFKYRHRVYRRRLRHCAVLTASAKGMMTDTLDKCSTQIVVGTGYCHLASVRLTCLRELLQVQEPLARALMQVHQVDTPVDTCCFLSRFILARTQRQVWATLARALLLEASGRRIRYGYGDCPVDLLHFYLRLGFRPVSSELIDRGFGPRIPLVVDLVAQATHSLARN